MELDRRQLDRRQAVQLLVASGAVTTSACLSPHAHAAALRNEPSMTLSIGNYGMQMVEPEQVIDRLAAIGFDGLELCVREAWTTAPKQLDAVRRTALRKRMADRSLRLTAMMEHLPPSPGEVALRNEVERLQAAAKLSRDLAPDFTPLIQTVLGGGDWQSQRGFFKDRIAAWVKTAREEDFRIAIKPHRGGAMSRPAEARWVIEQLEEPAELGLVYDYSHYAFRDIGVRESIQEASGSLMHVAIKDAARADKGYRFELPGATGEFDYVQLFRELATVGYRNDICCEVSSMVWRRDDYEPFEAARRCYQAIAPQMEEAGVRKDRINH